MACRLLCSECFPNGRTADIGLWIVVFNSQGVWATDLSVTNIAISHTVDGCDHLR